MRNLLLTLTILFSLCVTSFAQGGMGPGPGTPHSAGGGGSFPTNGVLDDFNRADESPAVGWTVAYTGASNVKVDSNNVVSVTGNYTYAYWDAGTFNANQEAYLEIVTAPIGSDTIGLLLRWEPTTGAENGYLVQQAATEILVWRITDSGFAQLGPGITNTPAGGDSIGATISGTTITVYYKVGAGAWSALDTRTDGTHTAAGYIGMQLSTSGPRGDNFGGGAL